MRRCLTCGVLSDNGSYCRPCQLRDRGADWNRRIAPAVRNRDGHACVICGAPCPHPKHHHVDHIEPRGGQGSNDLSNLRTVCAAFNLTGRCKAMVRYR